MQAIIMIRPRLRPFAMASAVYFFSLGMVPGVGAWLIARHLPTGQARVHASVNFVMSLTGLWVMELGQAAILLVMILTLGYSVKALFRLVPRQIFMALGVAAAVYVTDIFLDQAYWFNTIAVKPNVSAGLTVVSYAVLYAIVVPVLEEIFMRGLLLDSFLKHYPQWAAVLLSSLLFTLFHLEFHNWSLSVMAFFSGLLFALWRIRSGSLVAPIICHVLINGLACYYSMITRAAPPEVMSRIILIQR